MVKGSSYGQRRPPLTLILKTILERYPDGGQILKEIIQNADDAGAKTVNFLLDSRAKYYGTNTLYKPELAKFQGPALYAQNDALFTDQDWSGIESLMQSNKKEDPMKVGRFGIGFNSVYHITDLPSIVSGERLAFLDPHEKYFGRNETGQSFNLNDADPEEKPPLTEFYDQFSPFEGVLGCRISKKRYQGTLFRFPLRNEPSDLSKKTYSADNVRLLFKSLQEEASLILLFLKNVDKICIYETSDYAEENLLFSVQVKESCRDDVRRKKQQFLQRVYQWTAGKIEDVVLSLKVTFEEQRPGRETLEHEWFVHNRIGARNVRLRQLASELALLPWMGFATPLTVKGRQAVEQYGGRLFCFLPLPLDSDVKTELPVHVHGAFGLSDNRRELKWPGGERQNDEAAEWNQLLLDHVGAKAYAKMLVDLIQTQMQQVGNKQVIVSLMYKAWPEIQKVQFHWKRILAPMFNILVNENILWSPACGGQWIKVENAILDRMETSAKGVSQAAKSIVQKLLIEANQNVVEVPPHILQAIEMFMQNVSRNEITPGRVRNLLRIKSQTRSIMSKLSKSETLLLLEYVVSDKPKQDLQGVPLLPLANGNFTMFTKLQNINLAVYVASLEMPRSLLPNMEERFLYDAESYAAHRFLCSVAQMTNGATQLVALKKELVPRLLKNLSLPKSWFGQSDSVEWHQSTYGSPPLSWLVNLWNFLRREFPYDISSFEEIPLILTNETKVPILLKLRRKSRVMRQTAPGCALPTNVMELLRKAGVFVLTDVPSYMEHNCLPNYVALPNSVGVFQVLNTVGAERCLPVINTCSLQQRKALRDFMAGSIQYLTTEQIALLRLLPIFDNLNGDSLIAVTDHSVAPRDLSLPREIHVNNSQHIISIRDENSRHLLELLGIRPMKKTLFLKEHVLSGVQNKGYSHSMIVILMLWVLQRLQIFCEEDAHFANYLRGLEFVPVGNTRFVRPTDVFDPRDYLLPQLFIGEEEKFPQGEFREQSILSQLQLVGMKTVTSIQASDLASVATEFSRFDESKARLKAQAMLKLLNNKCDLLNNSIVRNGKRVTLKAVLDGCYWVPCLEACPESYPCGMNWYGSSGNLFRPGEMTSLQKASVIGATMPVLENEVDYPLAFVFGWHKEPPISKITEQLKIAVTTVKNCANRNFQLMLQEIYLHIASCFDDVFQLLSTQSFPPWVWHGNGFAAPSKVIISFPCEINVEPYLFPLSTRYSKEVNELFLKFGARQTMNESAYLDVLKMVKEAHEQRGKNEAETLHDLHLSVNILNWIVREGKPLSKVLKEKAYVPVGTFDKTLKLVPCQQATFGDPKWLRKGGSESRNIVLRYTMIHEKISHTTAKCLGVPPISNRLTGAKPIGFHAAGPHESITTRLNNILKEYIEGVEVFKELVQNADDAGATEVKFLLDWRHHDTESLFSPGMKTCQGPALVSWSNSVFTDNDFQNIQKLAGATKKDDPEKIGRFGLGFNSVYHFTDVPSFVSRHFAVFFDPCTTHLAEMIEDKSRPGIMIDFDENPDSLQAYPDQFKPYHGLFGCKTTSETGFNYNGTIFRFPLRTKKSEISYKVYARCDMDSVIESLQSVALKLLLFVQNVKKVTVLELSDNSTDPGSPAICFELERKEVCELSHRKLNGNSTFLKASANYFKATRAREGITMSPPQQSEIVSLTHNSSSESEQSTWLTSSTVGDEKSANVACSPEGRRQGLIPVTGVAAKMLVQNQSRREGNYETEKSTGEAFCFLPLSIPTGLPIHVNGYFAVTSNRRDIWKQATTDLHQFKPIEVQWNESLMEDALSKAYINLLEDMAVLQRSGLLREYKFSLLWPNPDELTSHSWMPLIKGVYNLIATESALVQSGEEWLRINECIYPDKELQTLPNSLNILELFGFKIVNLPPFALKGFQKVGVYEIIKQLTMTKEKFLRDIFFSQLQSISSELRDSVVCFLLDECLPKERSCFTTAPTYCFELLSNKNYAYIPCSADGRKLAHPQNLISPTDELSKLFSEDEHRFPVGEIYLTPERLLMLEKLGMKVDLNWEDVLERCQSVVSLHQINNHKAARARVRELIRYMDRQLRHVGTPSNDVKLRLRSLRILPVQSTPPSGYLLQWKGSSCTSFLAAKDVYEDKYAFLVGAFAPVVDESETGCGKMGAKSRKLLDFRKPPFVIVNEQLKAAISFHRKSPAGSTEKIVLPIYEFFQNNLDFVHLLEEELFDECWIFVENTFIHRIQVAFKWEGYGAPYLYAMPDSLTRTYRTLFEAVGITEKFPKSAFIEALYRFKDDKDVKALDDTELSVVKCLLNELGDISEDILNKEKGHVPLPDEGKRLRCANELVINDAPWLKTISSSTKFVHHDVPAKLAYELGAKDVRTKQLGEISRPLGIPFGQREKLTDRIRSILKAYPRDVGILKELVQNADDAGASEIHFVYDNRNHKTERMFNKTWHEIQGPALCVYNNRPFSEDDLEGIQRLGIGSKVDDPTKTGQYGIGFNAVYHLTDCPSFISNGDTLCILDPQVRYAPYASLHDPGLLIPLNKDIRTDYSDSLSGYLEEFFDLSHGTMFRLPIRDRRMAVNSEISKEQISEKEIEKLMDLFRVEAKEILLFLNHVRKISLSKIHDGKISSIFSVSSKVSDDDTEKRKDFSTHVKVAASLETCDVSPFSITYSMKIKEPSKEESWLLHQCIGLEGDEKENLPKGKPFGLVPRAGVAAKISEYYSTRHYSYGSTPKPKNKAFCFLPLPVYTGLPVHVNGHFYLDSGRRHLWHDERDEGFGSSWNHFLKSRLLPKAYIALMENAKSYIPGQDCNGSFATFHSLRFGLNWYNSIFPPVESVESQWKELSISFYQSVSRQNHTFFPVQKLLESQSPPLFCEWLSTSQGFFNNLNFDEQDIDIGKVIMCVGFPLFHSPHHLFKNFTKCKAQAKELSPDAVINFLKSHGVTKGRCKIGKLPCQLEETTIASTKNFMNLTIYCMKSPKFVQQMEGLPLLLTLDNILRRFTAENTVFLSSFHDLVPSCPHLFVHNRLRGIIAASILGEKILKSNIGVREFKVASLESFLPHIVPCHWRGIDTFVKWEPGENGAPTLKWMERLWEFLCGDTKSSERLLDPLRPWPLLPTSSGQLVPIALAKKVLDLTPSGSWSPQQRMLVKILRKLKCQEVNREIVKENTVLQSYVALPHKPQDVIAVVDYQAKEYTVSGLLDECERINLLEFFQSDIESLNGLQRAAIKRLPFFTSIGGDVVSIDRVQSVYVVPPGIHQKESEVWMNATYSIFLAPCDRLKKLYTNLGVKIQSQVSCYVNFIFPHFSTLCAETRLAHLEYIKNALFYRLDEKDERIILEAMKNLPFIPDASGKLHKASNFYDPENPVFMIMLKDNKFPTLLFRESSWLSFLRKLDLKKDVNEKQFLAFAKEIEDDAASETTKRLIEKSETLVKYLLDQTSLHDRNFLEKVSIIKFVTPQKANDFFQALHPQYRSTGNNRIKFGEFNKAVRSDHEKLVWTSATLLPSWIVNKAPTHVLESLGVLKEPLIEQVLDHTEFLSKSLTKSKDKELSDSRRRELRKVMEDIYKFCKDKSDCSDSQVIGDDCTASCKAVGARLSSVPCVLVDDGRVLVRGDQLAIDIQKEFPPYLYKVPTIYGAYLHLFRRLGATPNPTPLQYANILRSLKDGCKDEQMHPDELRQAKQAVGGLFNTLKMQYDVRSKFKEAESKQDDEHEYLQGKIDDLDVLFLPSKDEKLMRSCDMVSNDVIRFRHRVSELQRHFLIDLRTCGVDHFVDENKLLPKQLRTKSIKSMVEEKIVPDCQDKLCPDDKEGKCQELDRIRAILKSPEFVQGILRILKHQEKVPQLDLQVKQKVEELPEKIRLRCMEVLETHLILKETDEPIPKSEQRVSFFATGSDDERYVHKYHGAQPNAFAAELCPEINFITGNHLNYENYLNLLICLTCEEPGAISDFLDSKDITPDCEEYAKQSTSETELGKEVPLELHQLFVQFADFIFYPGEIVVCEKEDAEDSESDPTYIFARIVRRIETHKKTEEKKKERKKGKSKVQGKQESILLSRYLIDIGDEQVEVDVLDLYKIRRQGFEDDDDEQEKTSEATGGTMSDSMALVLYKGTARGRSKSSKESPKTNPKPRNLQEALEEVRKAFAEIKKLPKDKQKKAIRRLWLRWHPDKNQPDMQEIANEVSKFIQIEATKLESGGATGPGFDGNFFRKWNHRARRQRSRYDNFRRSSPNFEGRSRSTSSGGASSSGFSSSSSYRSRSTVHARHWISQAKADMSSVKDLLSVRDPFYNLVCFQCHEVAEKALIAALFAMTGVSESQLNCHDVLTLAESVSRSLGSPSNLSGLVSKLRGYREATRFPHKHSPSKVPAEVYTYQQAQVAFAVAKEILEEIQRFIGIHN